MIILIHEAVIAIHIILQVFICLSSKIVVENSNNDTKKVDAKNDTGVNYQKKQEVVLNKLWK